MKIFNCSHEHQTLSSERHVHGALASLVLVVPVLTGLSLITLTWLVPPLLDAEAVKKTEKDKQDKYDGMIHKGLNGSDKRLSDVLLCRPSSLYRKNNMHLMTLLSNWTTEQCLEQDNVTPNEHVRSVESLMANESLWVACARQYINQSAQFIVTYANDTFKPSCPSYPKPKNNSKHAFLKVPIHDFVSNIFHMMVIQGRPLWCVLDAVTRFAAQAKSEDTNNNKWTVEYRVDPGKGGSSYVQ